MLSITMSTAKMEIKTDYTSGDEEWLYGGELETLTITYSGVFLYRPAFQMT